MERVGPYVVGKLIGSGSSSAVHRCMHADTKRHFAMKAYFFDDESQRKGTREIGVLQRLAHPNIVRLMDAYAVPGSSVLVMELVDGIELFEFISKKGALPELDAKNIFSQIVKGICACHVQDIVHRDLKAENILLDVNGRVRIVDFEMATFDDSQHGLQTFCGSWYYLSPEMCEGRRYEGKRTDAWCLGVLLYLMTVGEYPFDDDNHTKMLQKIMSGKYPAVDRSVSAAVRSAIGKLLTRNPQLRASSFEIRKHRMFLDAQNRRNLYFDEDDLGVLPPAVSRSPSRRELKSMLMRSGRQVMRKSASSASLYKLADGTMTQQVETRPFATRQRRSSSQNSRAVAMTAATPTAGARAKPVKLVGRSRASAPRGIPRPCAMRGRGGEETQLGSSMPTSLPSPLSSPSDTRWRGSGDVAKRGRPSPDSLSGGQGAYSSFFNRLPSIDKAGGTPTSEGERRSWSSGLNTPTSMGTPKVGSAPARPSVFGLAPPRSPARLAPLTAPLTPPANVGSGGLPLIRIAPPVLVLPAAVDEKYRDVGASKDQGDSSVANEGALVAETTERLTNLSLEGALKKLDRPLPRSNSIKSARFDERPPYWWMKGSSRDTATVLRRPSTTGTDRRASRASRSRRASHSRRISKQSDGTTR